jgi:endonuclease YncB( thermonuclease family)
MIRMDRVSTAMRRPVSRSPARPAGRLRGPLDILLAYALIAGLIAAAVQLLGREVPETTGAAIAIDGDTLFRSGERMRLLGLDAPELGQTCTVDALPVPCGRRAREALAALVKDGVSCRSRSRDGYGRALVTCRTTVGDLSEQMVALGEAVAAGCCRTQEVEARRARRGLWAGSFDRPADWRRAHSRHGPP